MKLSKTHLMLAIKLLEKTKPKFVEARLRDKILKNLATEWKQFDDDRVVICKELCKKDEKGELLMTNEGSFDIEDMTQFQKEYAILSQEDIKINLDGNEPERLVKLIETTAYTPEIGESNIIDEFIIGRIIKTNKPKTMENEEKVEVTEEVTPEVVKEVEAEKVEETPEVPAE
jgi:hypothetical protein